MAMQPPSISNLNDLFDPVQQQAQQTLAQSLIGTKGDKLAGLMYRQPLAVPNAPQLQFGITPSDNATSDFLGQGLGGGINNYLAMKTYGQQQQRQKQYQDQQQQLFDLAQQRDLAAAQQQQQDLAKQDKFLQTLPQNVRPYYEQSDKEGRRKILYDLSQPGLGAMVGQGKAAEAQASAQGLGDAAGVQKTAEVARINAALTNAGLDVNTPQGQNLFHALLRFNPNTQTDLDLKTAQRDKARVEAAAAPTLTAQDIQQNNLTMQSSQLNNVLQQIKIGFEPDRLKAEINGQQLTNQERADKISRIDTAQQIFASFQERLARGEVTPQDIAQVQSNIGFLTKLDPSLDVTLKRVLGLKQDDKLDEKRIKEVFAQKTSPSPTNWGIKPKAMNGNLVQAPSGNWYDKTTGKQVKAPMAAKPKAKPAVQPTVVQSQQAQQVAPQIWNSPAPVPDIGRPISELLNNPQPFGSGYGRR